MNYKDYKISSNIIEGFTAPRGRILDVNGKVLVDNMGVKTVIFNKLGMDNKEVILSAQKLASILDFAPNVSEYNLKYYFYQNNLALIDKRVSSKYQKLYNERKINSKELLNYKLSLITEEELKMVNQKEAYLYYLFNNGYSYEDKIIKENITEEEYLKINNANISGIRCEVIWERTYPYGDTLRDIFGLVSSNKQGIPSELKDEYLAKGYNLNDRVGISNLEYIYDDYLKGKKAKYQIEQNSLSIIDDYEKGNDLVLSIDINLQIEIEKILEEEMRKAKKEYNTKYYDTSYLIVSNPNTGEIIALVGKKIDSNNNFIDYSYLNVINSYAVGSAVKGASISVGYNYNIINENTKVKDGCITLKNQKPKCSWKTLGYLDDIEALRMSSNYFQYLIAVGLTGNTYKNNISLGATKEHFEMYRNILKEYGLGALTNIDLSNESVGMKGITISDDLLLNMAIGQYDTYTPIELSNYINTIASGKRKEQSLLKYVINNEGKIIYTKENKILNELTISDYYLNRIREGFKAVNQTGTGYSYTDHSFTSAGKTGTAESMLGNIRTINTSYVLYFPYEEPKYSIIMVSPNIKYQNSISSYKYPINARTVKRVSRLINEEY